MGPAAWSESEKFAMGLANFLYSMRRILEICGQGDRAGWVLDTIYDADASWVFVGGSHGTMDAIEMMARNGILVPIFSKLGHICIDLAVHDRKSFSAISVLELSKGSKTRTRGL